MAFRNPQRAQDALAAIESPAPAAKVQRSGYYGPEHDRRGYPVASRAAEAAHNESDAKRLWELSVKLTGVNYESLNTDRTG
jgi:hypothetical protein